MPTAVGAGVLIDADHALDYYNWYVRRDVRFWFVPLHAWELSVVLLALLAVWYHSLLLALLAVWYHPLLLAAALGHVGHLVADQVGNRLYPLAYSIGYRALRRFDRDHLMGRSSPPTFSVVLEVHVPLWVRFRPGLVRAASRIRRKLKGPERT